MYPPIGALASEIFSLLHLIKILPQCCLTWFYFLALLSLALLSLEFSPCSIIPYLNRKDPWTCNIHPWVFCHYLRLELIPLVRSQASPHCVSWCCLAGYEAAVTAVGFLPQCKLSPLYRTGLLLMPYRDLTHSGEYRARWGVLRILPFSPLFTLNQSDSAAGWEVGVMWETTRS